MGRRRSLGGRMLQLVIAILIMKITSFALLGKLHFKENGIVSPMHTSESESHLQLKMPISKFVKQGCLG